MNTPSHRKPVPPPLCYQHQYTFLLSYTLTSRVEREMSLDMVNDVLDVMAVDLTDDGLFSFMDNTVSGKKHVQSIHRQGRLT